METTIQGVGIRGYDLGIVPPNSEQSNGTEKKAVSGTMFLRLAVRLSHDFLFQLAGS